MADYNELSIHILSEEERKTHSAFSMLALLVEQWEGTSPAHLQDVAECLISFGWGIDKYTSYRNGTMEQTDLNSMNE